MESLPHANIFHSDGEISQYQRAHLAMTKSGTGPDPKIDVHSGSIRWGPAASPRLTSNGLQGNQRLRLRGDRLENQQA
jgi:hypothetical protein